MRALGLRFEKDGKKLDKDSLAGWDTVEMEWKDEQHGTSSIVTMSCEEATLLVLCLFASVKDKNE